MVLAGKVGSALRLAAVDQQAARLGLKPGMTLADARSRLPHLRAEAVDPLADRRLLRRIASACERYSPLVALDGEDGLLLDITGCAHLFGGEAELRADACARLARAGFEARASIACAPGAARALARFSLHAVSPVDGEESLIRSLPTAALDLDRETATALVRAGLKTVGDLADQPSKALSARFGEDLARRLARVLGREDARIVPFRPPPDISAERRFPAPLLTIKALLAALASAISEVVGLLERRGAGGRRFEASIFRTDGAVRRVAVETSRPSRDVRAILRLYEERLERLADPLDPGFGFDALRLAVLREEIFDEPPPELGEAFSRQEDLRQDDVRQEDVQPAHGAELSQLIDRLSVRFGRDRVLWLAIRDVHNPDRAALARPALEGPPASTVGAAEGQDGEPPLRPLRLFDPPQSIEAMAEVPDGPPLRFRWRRVLHQVIRAEGPERIEPDWWRGSGCRTVRDYYRLEDDKGRRFWVFRQGFHGEGSGPPSWFVHGLFA